MQTNFNRLLALTRYLALLLVVYFVCRLLFYLFYLNHFSDLTYTELLKLFFFGLRFDLSAIIACNALFIVLFLLPVPFQSKKWYKSILMYVFIVTNSIALLANCADLAYFRFTLKRTTFDVFSFMATGNDLFQLLPVFLTDFWYVFAIWIVLCLAIFRGYKKIDLPAEETQIGPLKKYGLGVLTLLFAAGASIIGFRGGFQLIPIYNVTAAEYTSAHNIPLVLNTPFSIIKTVDLPEVTDVKYFNEKELKTLYSPNRKGKTGLFKRKNVVILILESFSKEYIGYFNNGKGHTPFLDSLMTESLVFDKALANGKKSAEGIPAVLASIPTLMNEPYLTSIYGANTINSVANLLKDEGYTSAFYHGGTNGTMNFKEFCSIAGFDNYYGRSEYNNEADYDGHWGIWDEPYLQYFARQLNTTKQPFVVSLFTLSSHHPYRVPDKYKTVFKDGGLSMNRCIRYTDHSLGKFFEKASQAEWYNNTLFVITADHTGISESRYYGNYIGIYSIPVIFFDPEKKLRGVNSTLTQQTDIMPSILDYLNYSKPYFAFGQSVFDSVQTRHNVNYINDIYQLISDRYLLQFDGKKATALYEYQTDSLLKKNLLPGKATEKQSLENILKAYVQTYNSCLIHNKMKVE
ncbi:MAG: sulfatase-like hydrolase/transferase [Bacteroidetes bacterium]|nr:sulfatase-like hydrolase/transferase [Bacteroidota bacterium]